MLRIKNIKAKHYIMTFIVLVIFIAFFYLNKDSTSEDMKNKLEVTYYVCNIVMTGTIIIAVMQLNHSKKSMENAMEQVMLSQQSVAVSMDQLELLRVQLDLEKESYDVRLLRESSQITVNKCCEFGKHIIPLIDRLALTYKQNDIPIYVSKDKYLKDFNDTEDKLKIYISNNWKIFKDEEIRDQIIAFSNDLEGYAMNFTKGICDKDIAFAPISQPFSNGVELVAPFIIFYRMKNNSSGYSNVVELYKYWNEKKYKDELILKASELEKLKRELEYEITKIV